MVKCAAKLITGKALVRLAAVLLPVLLAVACAPVDTPDVRTSRIPSPSAPLDRYKGLNEKSDAITRVRLGRDVLIPQPLKVDRLPDDMVGPYEFRGETLASALQMILDDYDISLAFETNEGLTRKNIMVSNLHGKLSDVVNEVCSLADLYCHYEAGTITIKKTETFVVDLPPIAWTTAAATSSGASPAAAASASPSASTSASPSSSGGSSASNGAYTQIADGLAAVIDTKPIIDTSTRVIIYTATQRTNKYALEYFQRLRKNTALIVFETHIWEVVLNNQNQTGIEWSGLFKNIGNFSLNATMPGTSGATSPISITPAFTGSGNVTTSSILQFLATRGSVKTVSQPQITVLSGSTATFSVSQQQNYVSGMTITQPVVAGATATAAPTTATASTGLTMNVTSAWDQSTIYGNLNISLNDLQSLVKLSTDSTGGFVQLPTITTRSLQTQIRVRPGDAILIGGIVQEKNDLEDSGPGFMSPLFSTSRSITKTSSELVFLLRPRVVSFSYGNDGDTPQIVDAPKEGVVVKAPSVPDITDKVKGLFGQGQATPVSSEENGAFKPSPVPDVTDNVKDLFGQGGGASAPLPLARGKAAPSRATQGGVNQ